MRPTHIIYAIYCRAMDDGLSLAFTDPITSRLALTAAIQCARALKAPDLAYTANEALCALVGTNLARA